MTEKESHSSDKKDIKNEVKAKIIYDELCVKYDYFKDIDSEENILKKIIEFDFDEIRIKNYYSLEKIFEEMDSEYGISAFIDEVEIKNKIKELHCDKDLIKDWVEEQLLNQ